MNYAKANMSISINIKYTGEKIINDLIKIYNFLSRRLQLKLNINLGVDSIDTNIKSKFQNIVTPLRVEGGYEIRISYYDRTKMYAKLDDQDTPEKVKNDIREIKALNLPPETTISFDLKTDEYNFRDRIITLIKDFIRTFEIDSLHIFANGLSVDHIVIYHLDYSKNKNLLGFYDKLECEEKFKHGNNVFVLFKHTSYWPKNVVEKQSVKKFGIIRELATSKLERWAIGIINYKTDDGLLTEINLAYLHWSLDFCINAFGKDLGDALKNINIELKKRGYILEKIIEK